MQGSTAELPDKNVVTDMASSRFRHSKARPHFALSAFAMLLPSPQSQRTNINVYEVVVSLMEGHCISERLLDRDTLHALHDGFERMKCMGLQLE